MICSWRTVTFEGNSQTGPTQGGGAINHGGAANSLIVRHSTITGNSATGSSGGGGIFGPTFTLENSVVAGNTASGGPGHDIKATVNPGGVNFIGDPTGAFGLGTLNTDYFTGDPQLGALSDHGGPTRTRSPLFGSPLIDPTGGDASPGLTTDQRGAARRFGATADIGAVKTFIAHVDHTANGNDTGTSWTHAYPTLQDALVLDAHPLQILVAEGTYYPDEGAGQIDNDRASSFHLREGTAILGGHPTGGGTRNPEIHETILSGDLQQNDGADFANNADNTYHVVRGRNTITSATRLDGRDDHGGEMPTAAARTNAVAAFTLTAARRPIHGCLFSANKANNNSGACHVNAGSDPVFSDCEFIGNSAGSDGGAMVFNANATPSLLNCHFAQNKAVRGGALRINSTASVTLTNCSFQGNFASSLGGGIYNNASSSTLTNCSFQGNNAIDWGGGIFQDGGALTLINGILWNNSEGEFEDTSVFSASVVSFAATVSYSHCLVANSGGSDSWNSALGTDNGNNIDADPLFLASGDLRLQVGSPALNVGDDAANLENHRSCRECTQGRRHRPGRP